MKVLCIKLSNWLKIDVICALWCPEEWRLNHSYNLLFYYSEIYFKKQLSQNILSWKGPTRITEPSSGLQQDHTKFKSYVWERCPNAVHPGRPICAHQLTVQKLSLIPNLTLTWQSSKPLMLKKRNCWKEIWLLAYCSPFWSFNSVQNK